MQKLIIQKINL